jgi:hypothetical protein
MADSSSIDSKLKKFQSVCEDKLRKIENLQQQFEKNEEVLRGYEKDNSMCIEVAQLNLNIAQIQLDTGKFNVSWKTVLQLRSVCLNLFIIAILRGKKRTEQERHQLLEEET